MWRSRKTTRSWSSNKRGLDLRSLDLVGSLPWRRSRISFAGGFFNRSLFEPLSAYLHGGCSNEFCPLVIPKLFYLSPVMPIGKTGSAFRFRLSPLRVAPLCPPAPQFPP